MNILVILASNTMTAEFVPNILIMKEFFEKLGNVTYAGISSHPDFNNYPIDFKYKVINPKKQLSKVCDFISQDLKDSKSCSAGDSKSCSAGDSKSCSAGDSYDLYIKIRPEVKLLGGFSMSDIQSGMINGRARVYSGPRSIKYGISVGGEGIWDIHKSDSYSEHESKLMDDHIYIFDHSVIEKGGFAEFDETNELENERFHTELWESRGIPLNVIGIDLNFIHDRNRGNARSGHIN